MIDIAVLLLANCKRLRGPGLRYKKKRLQQQESVDGQEYEKEMVSRGSIIIICRIPFLVTIFPQQAVHRHGG